MEMLPQQKWYIHQGFSILQNVKTRALYGDGDAR